MPAQPSRAAPLPPAQRREALIEATIPLLMSNGTGVTTKELAHACGVAEGTLFRVFPDKESLIEAAIGRAFDPAPVLAELAAVDRQSALHDRLSDVVRILTARFTRTHALLDVLRLGGGDRRPGAKLGGHVHLATTDFQRINALVVGAIADVIAGNADELRCTPNEAGQLLRLLVLSRIHPGISGGPPMSEDQIIDFLLNGVRRHPC